jgi:hypothetical protein
MPRQWDRCALCLEPAEHAIVGNRLLWGVDVRRLPTEGVPSISWRCIQHQRYKMRPASVVWASELGDLFFLLTCGHQVQGVFRGRLAYTPALVERDVATRQIRLDQRQRCYLCADLERESAGPPAPGSPPKPPPVVE